MEVQKSDCLFMADGMKSSAVSKLWVGKLVARVPHCCAAHSVNVKECLQIVIPYEYAKKIIIIIIQSGGCRKVQEKTIHCM